MKEGARKADRALALLERACAGLPSGPDRVDALFRLARLLKRKKDHARLETVLDQLLALAPTNAQVLTELAKFQEHQRRDYEKALDFAERAHAQWKLLLRIGAGTARHLRDSERRIERLQNKVRTL
jgi:tetratricopeptide (TPR) repeat protein